MLLQHLFTHDISKPLVKFLQMSRKELFNYTMITFRVTVDTFKANGLESETKFIRLSIIDLARPLSLACQTSLWSLHDLFYRYLCHLLLKFINRKERIKGNSDLSFTTTPVLRYSSVEIYFFSLIYDMP